MPATLRSISVWPQEAIPALKDCLERTERSIFKDTATSGDRIDLREYTDAVLSFISQCTDDVTAIKTSKSRATNKPRLTGEVFSIFRIRDAAFRSGDPAAYREVRNNLKKAIEEAKKLYAQTITSHFADNRDSPCLWQGFQSAMGYKPRTSKAGCKDPSLPDNLYIFHFQFEAMNNSGVEKPPPSSGDQELQLIPNKVKTVSKINPQKATGSSGKLESKPGLHE